MYNGERKPANSQYDTPPHTGDPYPYDGHDGWDWSMGEWTDVLAAASGEVVVSEDDWGTGGYGHVIIIAHDNDWYTMYAHLRQRLVQVGDPVTAGQHIAESGSSGTSAAHLHFGVRHGGWANTTYAVDPFGWRGDGRDPLFGFNGKESSCLWAGVPGDDISCADIIVEDDGEGWTESGTWFDSINGNGYREHHTYSWDPPPSAEAYWMPTLPAKGFYRVYAFVPPISSRTTHAHYVIDNGTTQYEVYRDQSGTAPRWMSLGTFEFPAGFYGWVKLDDYTTEPKYSHWVAADSIKFSAIIVYLPDVKNRDNWTFSIIIRNNSTSSAQVGINYYDSSGGLVSYQTTTIAANGFKTKTPPSDFSGSAVVVGDQDVAVVVEQLKGTTRYRYAYTGQAAPATTLYLPQAIHDLGSSDEWHTNIWGLNA
ncbi:MAG: peptidoglycan DD-metalloendopeptidase family protein, partial [Chloroflexota bacterium]|nr:peptidoglycan DD-metalloendopeptidase family protein [Chloroflexota bacterium]